MKKILVLLCLLHVCYGVIYRLNGTEYERMPPKYEADSFEKCYWDPDAVYCVGEFELFSNTPSLLLNMIHTKITKKYYCNQPPKDMKINTADIVVGVICALILLVNLIGSIYEIFCGDRKNGVSRFLLCFSIRKNWRKLTAPIAEDHDPRLKRLKSIHGFRTISTFLVIIGHSIVACFVFIDNTQYIEELYHLEIAKLGSGALLIMQTFLVMSGFLLVYNSLLYAEKHRISWAMLPKFIVLRWLRLTPSYAVVLALTVTWMRYLTAGPLWQELIGTEVTDCKQNWWMHMLYINNYNDNSQCLVHTWYLAADTQLYILGVLVYLACSTPRSRKIVLTILLVAGCVMPGLHTYYQNLDGSLIPSPEMIHNFMDEPTFNNTYRRGHTNLASYVIGLSMGYLIYHWQKKGIDASKFRKYRPCLLPLLVLPGFGICYISGLSIADAPRPSIYERAAKSILIKPLFGLNIALGIIAFVFKFEDFGRRIVEWRGWTVPARLSYSAYLIHYAYIKQYVAAQTTVLHTSIIVMTQLTFSIAVVSFLSSLPFWMIMEAPVGNLMKEYILKPKKAADKVDEEKQNGIKQDSAKTKSDDEVIAIEKIINLKNLREIDGHTRM